MNFKLFVILIFIYGVGCDDTVQVYRQALKTCAAQFKMSPNHPNEADYFFGHGEFPAGKENMKCIFECVGKNAGVLDPTSLFIKSKLKVIAEAGPYNDIIQFLLSENILETSCAPADNSSNLCDLIYGIMKCSVDLKNKRKVRSAVIPAGSASKLRRW